MSIPNLDQPLTGGLTPPASGTPKPGDWVQVWARVVGNSSRPEDIALTLESKSDQYPVAVRREHVQFSGLLPDFVTQCTSLFEKKTNRLIRCTFHAGHNSGDGHSGPKSEIWFDEDEAGRFEER